MYERRYILEAVDERGLGGRQRRGQREEVYTLHARLPTAGPDSHPACSNGQLRMRHPPGVVCRSRSLSDASAFPCSGLLLVHTVLASPLSPPRSTSPRPSTAPSPRRPRLPAPEPRSRRPQPPCPHAHPRPPFPCSSRGALNTGRSIGVFPRFTLESPARTLPRVSVPPVSLPCIHPHPRSRTSRAASH